MTPREIASKRLAQAFNEWMRRYTEEPDVFMRDWETVHQFLQQKAEGKELSYGEGCAAYLTQLLDEIPLEADAA